MRKKYPTLFPTLQAGNSPYLLISRSSVVVKCVPVSPAPDRTVQALSRAAGIGLRLDIFLFGLCRDFNNPLADAIALGAPYARGTKCLP